MVTMAINTFVALLILFVVCNSAAVRNIKGEEEDRKMLEEIKRCFKAAKSLQTDPGSDKKTTVFLNKCEKFLKDIKLTESQKNALEKIGYKMEDIISEKGFGYAQSTEEEHEGEVIVSEPDEEKEQTESENAEEVSSKEENIPEEETQTEKQEPEEETKTEKQELEEHAKDAESPEMQPQPEVIIQTTKNTMPNIDSTAQAGINFQMNDEVQNLLAAIIANNEQQVPVNPIGENINQYGAVNQNFPPINFPNSGQENFQMNQQGIDTNQIFPPQPNQFQPPFQGHPGIPNQQPFIPNAGFQQQGFPVPGLHPDILLQQQVAQQQQAFHNPQFFNQPLDGGAPLFNQQPHQQAPAFFGNQHLPPQPPVGFNPQMAGNMFDPVVAQANQFVPQQPQHQQQPNVQNFYPMNDQQNPNIIQQQQDIYYEYNRRVEL